MNISTSFPIVELRKRMEYLEKQHDTLTAICAAQSKVIKTLKTYHADDFKRSKEAQLAMKSKRQSHQHNHSSTVRQSTMNQPQSNNFEEQLKLMTEQFEQLQSKMNTITKDAEPQTSVAST